MELVIILSPGGPTNEADWLVSESFAGNPDSIVCPCNEVELNGTAEPEARVKIGESTGLEQDGLPTHVRYTDRIGTVP